ncbi:hypothetical protein BSK59_01360 [Paenibacillus odorifer]|uniref:hypothetical protein n=1 Tax=Paenibacillus odorifer TaxID=189426 RepID=UPI00096C0AB5|nr:hypothetical protein [Paenibacillus odorifer]OME63018.1 hypothetical protein BSK59_01360 [Paenibacillus odorifer]
MKWVAQLPYYKIQREIRDGEQRSVASNRLMYLYQDRIVTRHREFPLKDIFDMSYRSMGDMGGMFYLHTSKGVYAYLVECDPKRFIEAFKEQELNKN